MRNKKNKQKNKTKKQLVWCELYSVPGIRTPKEGVATTSIPATIKAEMLLRRTSGEGPTTCREGGHQGRSTSIGLSTLRSPLPCWIRAPHRLRSRPRTPDLRWSGLLRPPPPLRPTLAGTAGKHKGHVSVGPATDWSGFWSKLIHSWTSLTQPIISSHLEREPAFPLIFVFLFVFLNQQNCAVGYVPPVDGRLWIISDLKGQVCSSCCLCNDKNKLLYLKE